MSELPSERRLFGLGASEGIVAGPAYLLADITAPVSGAGGPAEQARAARALQVVGERLGEAAARRRAAGHNDEAEILEAAQLMADDPSLLDEIAELALTRPAATAILEATERQADLLAAIPDPYLAVRAADVRRLGKQAARVVADCTLTPTRVEEALEAERRREGRDARRRDDGRSGAQPSGVSPVVVARDLGPADLAELELADVQIAGIALAEGSGTSHAAIVARGLGVPLVVGLGEDALSTPDGAAVILNGDAGLLVVSPGVETLQAAQSEVARQARRRELLAISRKSGAITTDGHQIRLLVNASTEREALAGLEAGAEGIGLLRTELAFLEVAGWPSGAAHAAAVRPVLARLGGRTVTVRTLDFGADKTPPFLRGRPERGVALQLAAPGALLEQLRGLLLARACYQDQMGAHDARATLRIMLPLVEAVEQLAAARELLTSAHADVAPASPLPQLGAMIETRAAVKHIDAIAAAADFLSIGTNDLAGDILGVDRLTPAATVRAAADPRVLAAIRAVTSAAQRHGRAIEVCGEAAGDPGLAILLLGLGVSELSVVPSRLDEVRAAIQSITLAEAIARATAALGDA